MDAPPGTLVAESVDGRDVVRVYRRQTPSGTEYVASYTLFGKGQARGCRATVDLCVVPERVERIILDDMIDDAKIAMFMDERATCEEQTTFS